MSVATIGNWGANFVFTVSFLTLLAWLNDVGTFLLFGGLTVVAFLYFFKKVPGDQGPHPRPDRGWHGRSQFVAGHVTTEPAAVISTGVPSATTRLPSARTVIRC